MIVATAGHVDHGKTQLVKALTGADTDRLPEEKARGLSIDLGFAYQSLPGNDVLGFVDVPGHEKFIRNMLAGVSGIDLGLLVVAADDGIMPQTLEHFSILNLLGIERCIVALTKIDRVDGARVLEVRQQVEQMLETAGHRNAIVYPVCAPDNHGVDALREALHEQARQPRQTSVDGQFRMAIDRVFTLRGVGLVVTGMVFAGQAGIDESLVISADGSQVRVRGIRSHDQSSDRARAGERCAINIAGRGVDVGSVRRGDWLLDSSLYLPTNRIDVDLRVLESETRPLKHWTATQLHIGAGRVAARVAILQGGSIKAGERGLVQLVMERDVFALHGDRFVLRDHSARRTIAGGQVIDPFSPKRGRARPERIVRLQAMNRREPLEALAALTRIEQTGVAVGPFRAAFNLRGDDIETFADSLSLHRVGGNRDIRVFDEDRWQELLKRIAQALERFHDSCPELPGASLRDIQLSTRPYTDTAVIETAIAALIDAGRICRRAGRFHLPSHEILVSGQDRLLLDQVNPLLAPRSGSPMSLHQAAQELQVDNRVLETALKNAVQSGEMVLLAKNRYAPIEYVAKMAAIAESLAQNAEQGCFTVAEYCKHSETGRNFAIGLLEYFDRIGFTERRENLRRVKRPAASVFAVGHKT